MPAWDALLVGYERQENLGLRSLLAYLHSRGRRAGLVPFSPGNERAVIDVVTRLQPRLVGFSLIFQYSLEEFGRLMAHLRANGVTAHFTAGGHFPSLRPEQTLQLLPELDTVVRFEGEHTLDELLGKVDDPADWADIEGLAFRAGARTVQTRPRPLVADLDSLPTVSRDGFQEIAPGIKTAAMLASRGCLYDCAFCSIRQFYGAVPGALRRTRAPGAVVAEMQRLFAEHDVRFFSFQDDDFAARTVEQRRWVDEFLQSLERARLAGHVRWKISCRVDDIEPGLLGRMLQGGLAAVYLGVESGNERGLRALHKRVTVEQNLRAIDALKRHDVAMSIGFMLFDPSSTVETVRENLAFLRRVGDDGHFPVNFCEMLPYAGTPIEAQLRHDGRLEGTTTRPSYRALDPRLHWYQFLVRRIFTRRNFEADGLVALLQQADFAHRLGVSFGVRERCEGYGAALRGMIRDSNLLALDTLERLLDRLLDAGARRLLEDEETLLALASSEWKGEAAVEVRLKALEAAAEPLQAAG